MRLRLGRCLSALMADLDAWHQDESHYKREALGISEDAAEGQAQRQLPGMMFRPKPTSDLVPMSWQQFRNFYAKCHNTLARVRSHPEYLSTYADASNLQALVSCWAQTDFMHIKNAITVGLQVIKYFPVMDTNGKAIEDAVKSLVAGNNGTLTPDVQHQCQA
jgi:THO complex subunit 2